MEWFWDLSPMLRGILAAVVIAVIMLGDWKTPMQQARLSISQFALKFILIAVVLWACGYFQL